MALIRVRVRLVQVLAAVVALAAAGAAEHAGQPAAASGGSGNGSGGASGMTGGAGPAPILKKFVGKSAEDRATGAPEKTAEKGSDKTGENPVAKKGAKEEPKVAGRAEAEAIWGELMAGNKRFMGGHMKERELIKDREDLVAGQHPDVMVLGCADSRVAPEVVFDKSLGELFVVRVAGNVAEPSAVGSLEYACEHLHTKVLVVLGHEKCGAVAAAASEEWMPSPNLYDIVKRISPALTNVEKCRDADELSLRQVAANVGKAADDVLKMSPILSKAVEEGDLTVIRAVYHLKSGEVERLEDGEGSAAMKKNAMAGTAEHGR